MAFDLQKILITDEEVLYQARVSYWDQFGTFVIGVLLIPVLIGFLFIYIAQLRCQTKILVVTSKRVISKKGIFNTNVLEFPLGRIESIGVDQSVVGSSLGFGSVTISGTGGDKTPIASIVDPQKFQREFLSAVSKEHIALSRSA